VTSKPTFPLPCLALVTDRNLCISSTLEQSVDMAIRGGVNLIQLREKDLPSSSLLKIAQSLRLLTKNRAFFVINERIDVALACEADGIQLGEQSIPANIAKHIIGSRMLIGRSVHTLEGAIEAQKAGADFIILGTIFKNYLNQTRHRGMAGIDLVSRVSKATGIPVIAIGGITKANAGYCIQAGASGVAVITAILGTLEVSQASREIWTAVKQSWVDLQGLHRIGEGF
jgi:thiamine-phosphate pyrophosphorylase